MIRVISSYQIDCQYTKEKIRMLVCNKALGKNQVEIRRTGHVLPSISCCLGLRQ